MTDTPKGNFDWEMIGNHNEAMDSRHLQLSISQEAHGASSLYPGERGKGW